MGAREHDTLPDRLMRGSSPISGAPSGVGSELESDAAAAAVRVSLSQVLGAAALRQSRFTSAAVGAACGPAESLLPQDPAALVESCASREELVLFLASASRTLQFYCGGHVRNEFRWQLVTHAMTREPTLLEDHAGFVVFAAVESGRQPPTVPRTLESSLCPFDIHASAHHDSRGRWREQLATIMPDLHQPTTDSRVRHLIAHELLTGAARGDDERRALFQLHFASPTAPGTPASVLRDAVPVLLALDRYAGAASSYDELWEALAAQTRSMGFGQEWTFNEACRAVALMRVDDMGGAREISRQVEAAARLRPECPGLVDAAELLSTVAEGRLPRRGQDFACLGGSREQWQFLPGELCQRSRPWGRGPVQRSPG